MILNERQYMITKAQIKKFQSAIENLEKKYPQKIIKMNSYGINHI